MHHLAVISLKGGTGRTTIAANLGAMLAERLRTVLVDLDAQNALGLAFGMPVGEAIGLSAPDVNHTALASLLRSHQAQVPYIPFGRQDPTSVALVEQQLRTDPQWLERRLKQLAPTGYDIAVIDTPARQSPWLTQALAIASVVMVVLEACPLSYALLPEMESLVNGLEKKPGYRKTFYVLNRVDGRRALSRDVRAALSNVAGELMIEAALPDDEHVREAIANRTTCVRWAPHAQFSAGLREVATRVLEAIR
ncbi:MAG: cellulose biosynthesis protein BcsQ [Myxococcota bacterium]